jgi:hypothetical protein
MDQAVTGKNSISRHPEWPARFVEERARDITLRATLDANLKIAIARLPPRRQPDEESRIYR